MSTPPAGAPYRNPRTNPFGKYVTGFFNFRTEFLPLARGTVPLSGYIGVIAFWGGLLGGSYYCLNKYNEYYRFKNELLFQQHQTDIVGGRAALNYPEDVKLHSEAIKPYHNHMAVRQEMVFGNNGVFKTNPYSYSDAQTRVRNAEDKIDSTIFHGGLAWNVHRYTKAKPLEDYDAIRLRALFNLATAAYHENRAPGLFLPLATQIKLDKTKEEVVF